MRAIINKMILFIVAYIFFMVARHIVLPHLNIFPYIPPQILWVTLYNLITYIFTMVFHWILIALIIIYIIWIIIKRFIPNFPIPLKKIFLSLPPFKPLEKAGVLPLIDDVKKIITGGGGLGTRILRAFNAIGKFLSSAATFLVKSVVSKGKSSTSEYSHSNTYRNQPNSTSEKNEGSQGFFNTGEEKQIEDEYQRCIEENTVPIYPDISKTEKLPLMVKNGQASIECRLKMLDAFRRLTSYREFY